METKLIIKYALLALLIVFYLVYTIRYAIKFKNNNYFTGRRKTFHSVMIWLFPFFWILILKSFVKPIPGSYEFKDKKDPDKFEDNTTDWVVWAASTPPETGSSSGESH